MDQYQIIIILIKTCFFFYWFLMGNYLETKPSTALLLVINDRVVVQRDKLF